jgi:transcriptional regulator with XRE-family HTH domain
MVEILAAERIGERIRSLRQQQRMSLKTLSQQSGVSLSMISLVERGEKQPTLVVAAKIAQALGTTLSELLTDASEQPQHVFLQRRSQQTVFIDPTTAMERRLLSPAFKERTIEIVQHCIPPNQSSGDLPAYKEGTEKYVVLEQGQLQVALFGHESEVLSLEAGDCAYFEADRPHRFENRGTELCQYILVIVFPRDSSPMHS